MDEYYEMQIDMISEEVEALIKKHDELGNDVSDISISDKKFTYLLMATKLETIIEEIKNRQAYYRRTGKVKGLSIFKKFFLRIKRFFGK